MELEFELKPRKNGMHKSIIYDIERKGLNVGMVIFDTDALPETPINELIIK